jgi:ABC-type amino acid transport substrate-binding protein
LDEIGVIATVLGLVVAIVAYLWPRAPKEKETLQPSPPDTLLKEVRERGVLKVGVFSNPPLVSVKRVGDEIEVDGVYADILRAIAQRHNLELSWVHLSIAQLEEALTARQIDCVPFVFQTATRSRYADFTAVIHSVDISGVVRHDENRIRSQADLRSTDVRIAVCRGEIGHEFAVSTLRIPPYRFAAVLETHDIPQIASLVRTNGADIALADALSCRQAVELKASGHPLKVVLQRPPLTTCHAGMMIPAREPAFAAWLQEEVQLARRDPAIARTERVALERSRGVIRSF